MKSRLKGKKVGVGLTSLQATMFPERLDDYITEHNSVRVIDVFINYLDLSGLEFKTVAENTGRPGYNPSTMLKLYVYGYLNKVQSSRRLEREAQRNVELMWLLSRLAPDSNDPFYPGVVRMWLLALRGKYPRYYVGTDTAPYRTWKTTLHVC